MISVSIFIGILIQMLDRFMPTTVKSLVQDGNKENWDSLIYSQSRLRFERMPGELGDADSDGTRRIPYVTHFSARLSFPPMHSPCALAKWRDTLLNKTMGAWIGSSEWMNCPPSGPLRSVFLLIQPVSFHESWRFDLIRVMQYLKGQ